MNIFRDEGRRRQLQNKIQICLPVQVNIFTIYLTNFYFFNYSDSYDNFLLQITSRALILSQTIISQITSLFLLF